MLHSENFREEILYNANQTTPALSSYFELMDRLIPSFLSTLSSQKIKGTRILLQVDDGRAGVGRYKSAASVPVRSAASAKLNPLCRRRR